ncbi:hypothetical protein, partial [Pantoea ananatis]|uniref:hypothetical protein n=1 Tax=Pantoea ananas TaxID=553 RepID=UPI001E355311
MPVKERMPVILVSHVYGTVYPPAHTFVHDLSIIPLAHMFQGGNKLSLQHTSLSETLTKTANKYQKTPQVLNQNYSRRIPLTQIH